jgi:hypothetical protein
MVFLMNRARHDHQDNLAESYQDQDQTALLAGSGSFRSSRRVSVACPEGLMPERWQRWRIQLIPLLPDVRHFLWRTGRCTISVSSSLRGVFLRCSLPGQLPERLSFTSFSDVYPWVLPGKLRQGTVPRRTAGLAREWPLLS